MFNPWRDGDVHTCIILVYILVLEQVIAYVIKKFSCYWSESEFHDFVAVWLHEKALNIKGDEELLRNHPRKYLFRYDRQFTFRKMLFSLSCMVYGNVIGPQPIMVSYSHIACIMHYIFFGYFSGSKSLIEIGLWNKFII